MAGVNMGYDQGEYDVEIRDGKIHISSDVDSDVGAHGFGKVTFNDALSTFNVTDWKSIPYHWPFKKLFGVYKQTKGE